MIVMFKDKIKEVRKELHLTQDEFAKKLNISRSYLGDLERGRLKGNNAKVISKLSDVTGKPMEFFLDKSVNDEIKPYDFLDAAIEMLISKNMIDDKGRIVNDKAKKIIDDMLQKEILLKLESKDR
jgi:transcriptional regulator with XRE-family HTH domain